LEGEDSPRVLSWDWGHSSVFNRDR
jgi:hypothetical protein